MIRLAKPAFDIGLSTNDAAAHDAFWREQVELPFDAALVIGPGHVQFRFHAAGSIVKVNGFADPLPKGAPGGYREIVIARDTVSRPERLEAPDNAVVTLVPMGYDGISQVAVRVAVRDVSAHRRFYAEALDLPEIAPGCFRAGDSLLVLEADPAARSDAWRAGAGWRYLTLQVFKADAAHARALAHGAQEVRPPKTMGAVARFSIIRDPDGNAIELSQRASLVGDLDP